RPVVRTPAGASLLRTLAGKRKAECVDVGTNSHLLESLSAMPLLHSVHEPGEYWLACWAGGSAATDDAFAAAQAFAVDITAGVARVLSEGAAWWTSAGGSCGESTAARRAALAVAV